MLKRLIFVFKPVLTWVFLNNPEKVSRAVAASASRSLSGMVSAFNFWHHVVFESFFERVKVHDTDIQTIRNLNGPIVFVLKNRGSLEYRYFNYLFLKEKLPLVHYANKCFTLHWWPWRALWQTVLSELKNLFDKEEPQPTDHAKRLGETVMQGHNVLLNLTISRDYLFGLVRRHPLDTLSPLLDIHRAVAAPLYVVTLQFLYDKHPDKSEKSYFDLLFGEKSNPGAIRKIILFFINYYRSPQVKFGAPINLKDFFATHAAISDKEVGQEFLKLIENDLSVEKARITGPKLKSREILIDDIMADQSFQDVLQNIEAEKKSKRPAAKEALRYLKEIAADVHYSWVHFAHVTLSYVWNRVFDGVVVKHDQLARVREAAGKNPMVLVPMHRSHIDYLLISDLFYQYNITFPHVCAGINMNFWPVGKFFRKCGAFFIRRSFEGNRVYKESLYAYIKRLVGLGHSLEFYIEGTRSRTGKLLKPKMGILSLILRSFFEKAAQDIVFVPIAVVYDDIPEQRSYKQEKSGVDKKKETAGDLIKARKVFGRKYGKVYIEFAEPISLKNFCESHGIAARPGDEMRKEVSDFAYHLTYHINRAALVTPTALVATVILTLGKKTFEFEEIVARIAMLKDYLDYKEVTYSDLINYSERYAYTEALKKLCERGILKMVESFEGRFYHIDDERRAELDYYKNNALHFFVSLSCFLKALASTSKPQIELDEAVREFERIKTYFRHDFTFSERRTVREHLTRVIKYCENLGLVTFQNDVVTKALHDQNRGHFDLFATLLDNFLESHLIGLRYLKHHDVKDMDLKALNKDILAKATPMFLKGDLKHPESLSRFNLENSFKFFVELGILSLSKTQDKKHSLYSRTVDVTLIDQWIESVLKLLDLRSVITADTLGQSTQSDQGLELH